MQTQPIIKSVRKAFDALHVLEQISWTHYQSEYFDLCKAEEKSHRGFLPDFNTSHTLDTAGVTDAAKLFAVKRIAEYMNGEKPPSGKDYLHIQKSCFYAAGLVDEFRDKIAETWASFDISELAELDYCKIVKVRRDDEKTNLTKQDANTATLSPKN